MKKNLKSKITFALATLFGATAITLSACTKDPTPTPTPSTSTTTPIDNNSSVNSGNTSSSENTSSVDTTDKKIPTEKVSALLDSMGTNYTYYFQNEENDLTYKIDGDKLESTVTGESFSSYYYTDDTDNKSYSLVYDTESEKYNKEENTFDINGIIHDALSGTLGS